MREQRDDRAEGAAHPRKPPVEQGGMPGGGAGRRDEPGRSGVYPFESSDVPEDASVLVSGAWGRSDYEESGESELSLGPSGGSAAPSSEKRAGEKVISRRQQERVRERKRE
jgi:hypothetical protein